MVSQGQVLSIIPQVIFYDFFSLTNCQLTFEIIYFEFHIYFTKLIATQSIM